MHRLIAILLVLILASLACRLDFNPPPLSFTPDAQLATSTPIILQPTLTFTPLPVSPTPLPPPTETPAPTPGKPAIPELSRESLRHATLSVMTSDQVQRTFTLQAGVYQEGSDPATPGYVALVLGEIIAFGDLNADGLDDAVVTLAENYGGTGVFVSVLAILNESGQPKVIASVPVDDRPIINALLIENGQIYLEATVHGLQDPGCCAAQAVTRSYRLIDHQLILSAATTRTLDGIQRIISLNSPADQTETNQPFVIQGSVTVSPFENNLVYSVFLPGNPEPVAKASFLVSADGLGGPGTFELPLDFSAAGFKGPIRIEIADLSPADGSILALKTLYLTLK